MNKFFEQLVRVLTNACSRSQKKFGERVSPGPTISEAFLVFLVAGGHLLLKRLLLIHLDCLCSVSFPISVFFTHSLLVVLRKGQGTISKRRGLVAYVRTMTSTANFWAQIIFDPYRRPKFWPFCLSVEGGFPGYDVRPSA